jgi:peptidoglycan/LPS O-acetylase OafA/YrhL
MISVSPAIPYAFFALLVTLLLAWLSFRFFESRFLNLKERWTVR